MIVAVVSMELLKSRVIHPFPFPLGPMQPLKSLV